MTAAARGPAELAGLPFMPYQSLVADFRALAWCRAHAGDVPDERLLANFHGIHESFLRGIDRQRPELFAGVDRGFLLSVVRRWITLYLRAADDLAARFPRTDESADLIAREVNWSERLDIAYEGLDRLDVVSRYAEYWAERTITWVTTGDRGAGVHETYQARLELIGSPYYRLAEDLMHDGRFMFFDPAGNGITAFELRRAFAEVDQPADVDQRLIRDGWILIRVEPLARDQLWRAAR